MAEKIQSKNELFFGEEFDKPPLALFAGRENKDRFEMLLCPHCGKEQDPEHCDCLGAEPNCLFCFDCHREFEIP
jgi:hypothetical protein